MCDLTDVYDEVVRQPVQKEIEQLVAKLAELEQLDNTSSNIEALECEIIDSHLMQQSTNGKHARTLAEIGLTKKAL